jgi:hypothetical protein
VATTTELDDILIVEQDCSSEMLISKKALIVENHTNFVILAKALNIPSIYRTGKIILGGKTSLDLTQSTKQDT